MQLFWVINFIYEYEKANSSGKFSCILVSIKWRQESRNCAFILSFVCDLYSFALHSSFNWSLESTTFLMSAEKNVGGCLRDVFFSVFLAGAEHIVYVHMCMY